MNILEKHYNNFIKYNLALKFNYKDINKIPKIKSIILNFGCKTSDLKKLSLSFLILQLITKKRGKLTLSKKSNIFLKIRKGQPVGCQVILKKKSKYKIAFYLFKIISNINYNLTFKLNKSKSVTFNIFNIFNFNIIENNYILFNGVNKINITLLFDNNINNEILFILNCLRFLKNEKHL